MKMLIGDLHPAGRFTGRAHGPEVDRLVYSYLCDVQLISSQRLIVPGRVNQATSPRTSASIRRSVTGRAPLS